MENGQTENGEVKEWGFRPNKALHAAARISIRGFLNMLSDNVDKDDRRPLIALGHGDPSSFPCFRTSPDAEDAISDALYSAQYNCYAPTIVEGIKDFLDISCDPATFIQGAVPQILEKTQEHFFFFSNIISVLKKDSKTCHDILREIPCITCPHKPEGSMYFMVKLNLSPLEDITDDINFCVKLAKEESVVVMPGSALGLKNWRRITFAIEPSSLEDGLTRIRSFCQRHAKK